MGAPLNFDARTVAPNEAFEPIPAGWYNGKIVESEMKATANGAGAFLALTIQIMDGQYVNRKVFDRLNLQNQNAVAQEIAYKTLSAICHATGVIQVTDSSQLHGIPMQVKVSLRPAGPGNDGKMYEANNEVKGYKPVENKPAVAGGTPWAGGPPTTTAAPVAVAPVAAPPAQAAYKVGDVVNGFQLTPQNTWVPVAAPPAASPATAPAGVPPWAMPPRQ